MCQPLLFEVGNSLCGQRDGIEAVKFQRLLAQSCAANFGFVTYLAAGDLCSDLFCAASHAFFYFWLAFFFLDGGLWRTFGFFADCRVLRLVDGSSRCAIEKGDGPLGAHS